MSARERLNAAVDMLEREAEARGLERGLAVAEQIVGWLSRMPDTARQAETRQWAEAAIAKARESKP